MTESVVVFGRIINVETARIESVAQIIIRCQARWKVSCRRS